jgi:Alternative complex III, ActD subunit
VNRKTSRVVIGLFDSVEKASAAAQALFSLSLPEERVTTISSVALPDGAVTKDRGRIRFPRAVAAFWFVGAAAGLGLTAVTYYRYPMVTAGKPIFTIPPAIIVTYEGSMLAAILATLVGAFVSIGLARFRTKKVFDPRIHEGKIALCAGVENEEQEQGALRVLRDGGGTDVRTEEGDL